MSSMVMLGSPGVGRWGLWLHTKLPLAFGWTCDRSQGGGRPEDRQGGCHRTPDERGSQAKGMQI